MTSHISTTKHAGEIMIDLLNAVEYVSRSKLAERGARGDYPMRVIAEILATYGFSQKVG